MDEQQWMQPLTAHIRALVQQRHFSEAENEAAQAMAIAPHAAQPHNLMGIIAESRNDHVQAMKHFRAAWALDPMFCPRASTWSATAASPGSCTVPCTTKRSARHALKKTDGAIGWNTIKKASAM